MGELYMHYYSSRKLKKKKERIKMVNYQLKKYSTSSVIKEMPSTFPEEGRATNGEHEITLYTT